MSLSYLRKSTASQSRATPPFILSADFITPATSLTIANTDVKLVINGAASVNKNSGGGTHRVNGEYSLTFDATDTATVGEMSVSIVVSGALPVFMKFWVLEAAVYDAWFAASATGYVANAPVNVAQINSVSTGSVTTVNAVQGTTQPVNFTGTAGSALVKTDAIDWAGTAITTGVPLAPTVAGRTVDVTATGAVGIDWGNIENQSTAVTFSATTVAAVSTVYGLQAGVITSTSIAAGALVAAVWDGLVSGHTTSGTFGGSLNSASSAGDPWSTAIPGAYAAGTAGHRLGNVPDVAAGAAGGLFIAGSNASTTVADLNITGNLSIFGGALYYGGITTNFIINTGATTLTGVVSATSSSNDVRGIKLAATGLDSISVTPPTGLATTFREKMVQVWEYCFGKTVKDDNALTITVMQGTGTTPQTTQTYTSTGGVDTINRAT